jgi:hypothetical protein
MSISGTKRKMGGSRATSIRERTKVSSRTERRAKANSAGSIW